jgi:hypothetical protein
MTKLITHVKLGNNIRPNMPKTTNLSLSIKDLCYDFFLSNLAYNSFHFNPLAFLVKNLFRLGILSSFDNSRTTLSSIKGK